MSDPSNTVAKLVGDLVGRLVRERLSGSITIEVTTDAVHMTGDHFDVYLLTGDEATITTKSGSTVHLSRRRTEPSDQP